jgi:hypothetical protein
MSKRQGRRWRSGLLAVGVVTAGLASATTAQAVTVSATVGPSGNSSVVDLTGSAPGERNDITVTPSGAVPDQDAIDPAFPLAPTSVLVTDAATPLGDVSGGCVRVTPNSASCTALNGIDMVNASLGSGGGDSFKLDPGPTGLATPMDYYLQTSEGDDNVSIPVSRGMTIWSLGGNDTITANDPSSVRNILIRAGAGDDRIQLTTAAVATVDCGDGSDIAQIVGTRASTIDCEAVTPGRP